MAVRKHPKILKVVNSGEWKNRGLLFSLLLSEFTKWSIISTYYLYNGLTVVTLAPGTGKKKSVACHTRSYFLLVLHSTEVAPDGGHFLPVWFCGSPIVNKWLLSFSREVCPFLHSRKTKGCPPGVIRWVMPGSHMYLFFPHPHWPDLSHLAILSCKGSWEI